MTHLISDLLCQYSLRLNPDNRKIYQQRFNGIVYLIIESGSFESSEESVYHLKKQVNPAMFDLIYTESGTWEILLYINVNISNMNLLDALSIVELDKL